MLTVSVKSPWSFNCLPGLFDCSVGCGAFPPSCIQSGRRHLTRLVISSGVAGSISHREDKACGDVCLFECTADDVSEVWTMLPAVPTVSTLVWS